MKVDARILRETLDAERAAKGVCRHCGGPVPCWSEWGDRSVGRRHTGRTWRKMKKEEET